MYNSNRNKILVNLSIISEGYPNKKLFYNDCFKLHKKILNHSPFNILIDASFIDTCLFYIPSEHHGPYLDAFSNNLKLNFDTILNVESHLLTLNLDKLNIVITDIESQAINSSKGASIKDGIVVVLTPSISTNSLGGSFENVRQSNDASIIVATTTDGYWEQVVIRAIGNYLGLGDEFELEGYDFLEPDPEYGFFIDELKPNLIYDPTILSSIDLANTKWQSLIPSNFKNQEQEINRHENHPHLADETYSPYSYSKSDNVLWEGGGGYRTKVYRYAHDCLMRRRIGYKNLPIKTNKVPLCHICESYIRQWILQGARTMSGERMYFNGASRMYNFA